MRLYSKINIDNVKRDIDKKQAKKSMTFHCISKKCERGNENIFKMKTMKRTSLRRHLLNLIKLAKI